MVDLDTGKIHEYEFLIDEDIELSITQFANKDICISFIMGERVYINCAMPNGN